MSERFRKPAVRHQLYLSKITATDTHFQQQGTFFNGPQISSLWPTDRIAIAWDFFHSFHHWRAHFNVGKEGRERAVTDPLCSCISETCFLHGCLFFSPPGKAQRSTCSNGQADRIHEWVTWNLFLISGFAWETANSHKPHALVMIWLAFHCCDSQRLFDTGRLVSMVHGALFRNPRGQVLRRSGYWMYESRPRVISTWPWASLDQVSWSFMGRYCIGWKIEREERMFYLWSLNLPGVDPKFQTELLKMECLRCK